MLYMTTLPQPILENWKHQIEKFKYILGLMKIGNHRKIGELTPITSIVDLPHLVLFSLDSVPGAQGSQE